MSSNIEIDFTQIAPRNGGKSDSFEELCCQLARLSMPEDATFTRLDGKGGDGGVECFSTTSVYGYTGWQAKYVFNIAKLLKQATSSIESAIKAHPKLTRYIICFPFDLTGPTGGRKGNSLSKFNEWRLKKEQEAMQENRQIKIEMWAASKLRALLIKHDASGGIREFFFNHKILNDKWFSDHLDEVKSRAGPRYTPAPNIPTNLWGWADAFGRTGKWSDAWTQTMREFQHAGRQFIQTYEVSRLHQSSQWPDSLTEDINQVVSMLYTFTEGSAEPPSLQDGHIYSTLVESTDHILAKLSQIESTLSDVLDKQYGYGVANSQKFRHYMAESLNAIPAANLDSIRSLIRDMERARKWIGSPACYLAFEAAFLLSGEAGTGKTHGICDAAIRRFDDGLRTCIVFGHQFGGHLDPSTQIMHALHFPSTMNIDNVLSALNASGQASGNLLIICIDAINETRPLRYWNDHLAALTSVVGRYPYLRLVVTCRTSYLQACIPESYDIPNIRHSGFIDIQNATRSFFLHHRIEPPIVPMLQPEFANPLYLRLLCDTLRMQRLRRLPEGWSCITLTIAAFLREKEKKFVLEHETLVNTNVVSIALRSIARAIVDSGMSSLSASIAHKVIEEALPQTARIGVVEWLVREDLLVEVGADSDSPIGQECTVRPSFERLGDFVLASEILDRCGDSICTECRPGGYIHSLCSDPESISLYYGILSALSIVVPERHRGCELALMFDDYSIREELIDICVMAFPYRNPDTFTAASIDMVEEALRREDSFGQTMNSLLSISWRNSEVDARWIDSFLRQAPLAKRDSIWCYYLHKEFECDGVVRRLIQSVNDLPLQDMGSNNIYLWCISLLWFTAAADRRVKDAATRSVIRLLVHHIEILPSILKLFMSCDDDAIKERVLLCGYGALICSHSVDTISEVVLVLRDSYLKYTDGLNNALIRDHIRCIFELAKEVDAFPSDMSTDQTMRAISSALDFGHSSDEQMAEWSELIKFPLNAFASDFYCYTMSCLHPWDRSLNLDPWRDKSSALAESGRLVLRIDMAKWIVRRIAIDFGYAGSACGIYDDYMQHRYGGGRSKPTWAERIGKKYQWVALHQLASRLHDNFDRQMPGWAPELVRSPLILLGERQLDPTLPVAVDTSNVGEACWWVECGNFDSLEDVGSDEVWVGRRDDIPSLEVLLSVVDHGGQGWRMLVFHSVWGNSEQPMRLDERYRRMWMRVQSYLVPLSSLGRACAFLREENFFGNWMPDGVSFLHGFVGEYPWATPFNLEPDDDFGRLGSGRPLPFECMPTWNQIFSEWEYDATLHEYLYPRVPARVLFEPRELWWNGKDGFSLNDGRTIFCDPSLSERGPGTLIVDADMLPLYLAELGLAIVWISYGEKATLGGFEKNESPRIGFNQIGWLDESGELRVEKRRFFSR